MVAVNSEEWKMNNLFCIILSKFAQRITQNLHNKLLKKYTIRIEKNVNAIYNIFAITFF